MTRFVKTIGVTAAIIGAFVLLGAPESQAETEKMTRRFASHAAMPVVLVKMGLEQPRADIWQPTLIHSRADLEMPRNDGSAVNTSVPNDVGKDGIWRLEVQWIELLNSRIWEATVDIPVDQFNYNNGSIILTSIFGTDGLLQVASDEIGARQLAQTNTVAQACGTRSPDADRDYNDPNYFTRLPRLPKETTPTVCPAPSR